MNKLALFFIGSISLSILSGCAVMSKEECMATNWHDQGYTDGMQGMESGMLAEYISACSEYVQVNQNDYNAGRRQGADVYCTEDNGFRLGSANSQVTDICVVSSTQAQFNRGYKQGYTVYLANYQLNQVQTAIRTLDEYMVDGRVSGLYGQLLANRNYLYSVYLRINDYANYVNQNARSSDVQRYDYSNEMANVPYPYAAHNAYTVIEATNRTDRMLGDIHHRIRDAEHRMHEPPPKNPKDGKPDFDAAHRREDKARREIDCLRHEEHRIMREMDDLRRRSIYTGKLIDNIRDLDRCGF